KIVYALIGIAVIGHIVLIVTAIRKMQPGGLWIPMAVQVSITAISSVQLFVMVNMFAKTGEEDEFKGEMCNKQLDKDIGESAANDLQKHRILWCSIGSALCLLGFTLGVAGFITNFLLYFELSKEQKEEDDRQNQEIVERQRNRLTLLRNVIDLQARRAAEGEGDEGIKTAKDEVEQQAQNPDSNQPKSAEA
ncbi:hypothetical protein PENTCL1PPCAC_18369, partial [Pristionchus entomophagus]